MAGGHLVMPLAPRPRRPDGAAADPRDPYASAAGLAPADRLRALGDLAMPRRRAARRGRGADPDGLGRAVPRCERRGHGSRHAGHGPPSPDLVDGRQDHDRLGVARQQGPGGHRSTLAVRCRLRRHRGGDPPAERRPLSRSLRRRLPQGPTGQPGYASPHPVRADLPGPPSIASGRARSRRVRPARFPGTRRGQVPGPADLLARPAWTGRGHPRR